MHTLTREVSWTLGKNVGVCADASKPLRPLYAVPVSNWVLFGKVLIRVLSKLGYYKERTNDPLTIISNPLFTVRWTCISLVAIWKMIDANVLQELAKFALDGSPRLHTECGIPDTVMTVAHRIDGYLMKAWAPVMDLHLAFDSEPWSPGRTAPDTIGILRSRRESISEPERIANEAVGVEEVDWRIYFSQKRMDEITHELMRRFPGVCFNELKSTAPIMIAKPSISNHPRPLAICFPWTANSEPMHPRPKIA